MNNEQLASIYGEGWFDGYMAAVRDVELLDGTSELDVSCFAGEAEEEYLNTLNGLDL